MHLWKLLSATVSTALMLTLILGACAPAEKSQPPPLSAASSSRAGAKTGWELEWEQTVAAARQEGTVVISGPTREVWRNVLTTFEKDFPEIKVEYTGGNSRDFWPRIFRERELDQYLWDLRIGGADPQVYEAKYKGVLEPVRPLLLLPEVVDEDVWFGGLDGIFFDTENEFLLGFVNYISFTGYVNRDIIPETELSSVRDLTNPRWRGKIVIQDPRGGAGLNALQVFLQLYGEDKLRDLLGNQDLVVANDLRQQAEWVIRGRYPIAIGLVPDAFLVFREQGLEINIRPIEDSDTATSSGTGGIQFFNRAPHPNAAKVYINWLLTKDVQTRLSAATKQNSRRLDVPAADPEAVPDPARMDQYIPTQKEELLPVRRRALQLARDFLR